MKSTTIQYILIIPRKKIYVEYYINGNSESHSMKYDEMYSFLCLHMSPPHTVAIRNFLYSFRPFFVSVEKNKVIELNVNQEAELKELRKKVKKIDYKKLKKTIREQSLKNNTLNTYKKQDFIFDQLSRKTL